LSRSKIFYQNFKEGGALQLHHRLKARFRGFPRIRVLEPKP
jgi:hypothetical protein